MIRASVIGYMPIIAASPTELSTVYELLKRSVSLAGEIQQQSIIVVLDQAIYALAQEIIFTHAQEFKQVVLRLGGFHMSMTMSVIGKRFTDSGLESILAASGVIGQSAVHGVMS